MSNILYITPDFYVKSRFAGGMGTKTKAIQAAWGLEHNVEVNSELDTMLADLYDVIIIELLGLRNDGKLEERVKALKRCPVPKLVHGSDSEIFRWKGKELDLLAEVVDLWIPNTHWQADYFRDFDLPVTHIVYEPIDCDLFRPSENPEKIIIAGGAINYDKNSNFFIELFDALNEVKNGYQTAFLGGIIWGGKPKATDMKLRHELQKVTDIFHGEVSQAKVATHLGSAGVAVLNPYYETCNRFDMELMAAGKARLCGPHVCYDERPVALRFDGSVEDCIEQLKALTNGFEDLPAQVYGKIAREYALENWSYEASLHSLNEILRRLL